MSSLRVGLLAISVASAFFVASTANATITSTASLSGFRYELYDLNPTDGVAASVSFLQGTNNNTAGVAHGSQQVSFGNMPNLVATIGSTTAESSYASNDFAINSLFSQTSTEIGSGDSDWSTVEFSFNFFLGANSGIRLYANSAVNFNSPNVGGNQSGTAETFLQIYGGPPTNSDFNPSSHYDSDSLYQVGQSTSSTKTLSAYHSNRSLTGYTYTAVALARSYAVSLTEQDYQHQISPVPEPETYAMMLAGLGILGAVARRRKAKQA